MITHRHRAYSRSFLVGPFCLHTFIFYIQTSYSAHQTLICSQKFFKSYRLLTPFQLRLGSRGSEAASSLASRHGKSKTSAVEIKPLNRSVSVFHILAM